MGKSDHGSVDCLSSMPEPIIHNILSFLSAKDVIRTSVLCKTWKHMLDSYPILEFHLGDYMGFHKKPDLLMSKSYPEIHVEVLEKFKKFQDYVDTCLLRFSRTKLALQKLSLFIVIPDFDSKVRFDLDILLILNGKLFDSKFASILEKWIGLAIKNVVKEFSLSLPPLPATVRNYCQVYCLPKTIFGVKSLTVLRLCGCNLKLEESCTIIFPSLVKLSLERVYSAEDKISEFINGCPVVEDIFINECWGVSKLRIFGLLKLKKVIFNSTHMYGRGFWLTGTAEIEWPSPEIFNFSWYAHMRSMIKMDTSKCLRSIVLRGFEVEEELFQHLISLFPIVEEFKIVSCDFKTKKKVKISSLNLTRLGIWNCRGLEDIEIDAPNLISFKYWGDCCSFSKINAPSCLQQVIFITQ